MHDRRSFIKNSGLAFCAFGLIKTDSTFRSASDQSMVAGVQLFTFFNVIDADVEGTLKKIASIGYKEIESAFSKKGGFYGMKAKEFSKLVKDQGMSWTSHHVLGAPFKMPANAKPILDANGKPITFPPMRNLKENMQELVDEAADGGISYLVCANTPTKTLAEINDSILVLNRTAESCKKAGLTLAYHNHTEEFEKPEGETRSAYEMFMEELSPDIKMELDLCWAVKAGIDPVQLFHKYPGRFALWHVKDLDSNREGPAPVGTGVIDFKPIFASANTAGMKHFFVEHDMPKDPFESIQMSYTNLRRIIS